MRETVRSLGAYFVLSGLLSLTGLVVLGDMFSRPGERDLFTTFLLLSYLLSAVFGAAFIFVGARLKHLLQHQPNVPVQLTMVAMVLALIRFSIVSVFINLYIWYQLKRMAKEAETELEEQVLR